MNVISIGVMIYSFWFKAYPVKTKLTNPMIPAINTDNENFSDIMFAITNPANINLLKSYEYFARFSLCVLFISQIFCLNDKCIINFSKNINLYKNNKKK